MSWRDVLGMALAIAGAALIAAVIAAVIGILMAELGGLAWPSA